MLLTFVCGYGTIIVEYYNHRTILLKGSLIKWIKKLLLINLNIEMR